MVDIGDSCIPTLIHLEKNRIYLSHGRMWHGCSWNLFIPHFLNTWLFAIDENLLLVFDWFISATNGLVSIRDLHLSLTSSVLILHCQRKQTESLVFPEFFPIIFDPENFIDEIYWWICDGHVIHLFLIKIIDNWFKESLKSLPNTNKLLKGYQWRQRWNMSLPSFLILRNWKKPSISSCTECQNKPDQMQVKPDKCSSDVSGIWISPILTGHVTKSTR